MSDETTTPLQATDPAFLFTPTEAAATAAMAAMEGRSKIGPVLKTGIPEVDSYFAPTRPGLLCGVLGQTHHGKSLLLHYLMRQAAAQLASEGKTRSAIFYVPYEESIEDVAQQGLTATGLVSMDSLLRGTFSDDALSMASTQLSTTQVFYIGYSARRFGSSRMWDPFGQMALSKVAALISETCKQQELDLAAVAIDYLQALPLDLDYVGGEKADERRLQVRRDVFELKRMAMTLNGGCTVWVAIQAKQELRGVRYDKVLPLPQLPGIYDGEETSGIGQRLDRLLSIWMPSKSFPAGTAIALSSSPDDVLVTDYDQMLIKAVKQKGNLPSGRTWLCTVDYQTYNIAVQRAYG